MRSLLLLATLLTFPSAAFAQQRPLVTEDPEVVGAGRVLVEAGYDYARAVDYPVSGLKGQLRRFPLIGISLGISSIAEVQIDGGLFNRLSITERRPAPLSGSLTVSGDSTWDVEDVMTGLKVRLISEGPTRPSFAIRTATKLPMASNEAGLGLDTIDFFSSLLVGKTVRSVRMVGNIGLGILSDPTQGDRQNDVLTYGLSVARAVNAATELVGEINGRKNTRPGLPLPGTESRGIARFGGRYTIGSWRADAAILFGLTASDPTVGVATGFTYVFKGLPIP